MTENNKDVKSGNETPVKNRLLIRLRPLLGKPINLANSSIYHYRFSPANYWFLGARKSYIR